jgi:membrane-anchored glycerophosphoryl diester phosphodiesterase (GDPDase)
MAFDDELGRDHSQPMAQEYSVSASGLVSRTLSLWIQKLGQYIIIVGLIGAVSVAVSFALLFAFFDLIGVLGADPISYLVGLLFEPSPNLTLIAVSFGYAIIIFVLNAIIGGAALKFTLDEYSGTGGDIKGSFSHSIGRTPSIIVVQLILSSLVAIVLTPATILTTRALEMIDISDPSNPIIQPGAMELLMSAMALFLVGGIFLFYFQVRFVPTLAIVISTDLSAIDSLKRSWELTSGNFLHVLGGLILVNIAIIALGIVVSFGVSLTLLPDSYRYVIESIVTALLFGAISYIFSVVLYKDLLSRSGSSSLDELML